ncbi:MAG: DUF2807 domain-containing protein [Bacteroidia bacterium]
MKILISSIALLFTTAVFSQTITEVRTVGDFTGIRTPCAVHVEITKGNICSVSVEGPQDELKDLKTEVLDGTLTIFCSNVEDVKVNVTVKDLHRIDVTGSSNTTTTNKLIVDSLFIIGSGASSMTLNVQANSIRTNLNGASNLKISGTTTQLDVLLSGASQLKAYQLVAEKAIITTSGASSAHVTATSSVAISTSGASEVHYDGNPSVKSIASSGASSASSKEGHTNTSDTTSIRVGKYDVHVTENDDDDERSNREKHADDSDFEFWEGIDFGVNGYLTADNKIELPAGFEFLELNYARSYFFSWNMFQKNIHIYRNNVNLGTGFGLSWYHYNFRNAYTLTPNADYQTATFDSTVTYSRNRLGLTYINVPLFLEFNTNNKDAGNSLHIGGGMEFGYNVFNNLLKQKYEVDGHRIKTRQKDDFNINPFRYDVIGRIGYGNFTLFGKYSLSSLFEKGHGPVVYPFTAGINITF